MFRWKIFEPFPLTIVPYHGWCILSSVSEMKVIPWILWLSIVISYATASSRNFAMEDNCGRKQFYTQTDIPASGYLSLHDDPKLSPVKQDCNFTMRAEDSLVISLKITVLDFRGECEPRFDVIAIYSEEDDDTYPVFRAFPWFCTDRHYDTQVVINPDGLENHWLFNYIPVSKNGNSRDVVFEFSVHHKDGEPVWPITTTTPKTTKATSKTTTPTITPTTTTPMTTTTQPPTTQPTTTTPITTTAATSTTTPISCFDGDHTSIVVQFKNFANEGHDVTCSGKTCQLTLMICIQNLTSTKPCDIHFMRSEIFTNKLNHVFGARVSKNIKNPLILDVQNGQWQGVKITIGIYHYDAAKVIFHMHYELVDRFQLIMADRTGIPETHELRGERFPKSAKLKMMVTADCYKATTTPTTPLTTTTSPTTTTQPGTTTTATPTMMPTTLPTTRTTVQPATTPTTARSTPTTTQPATTPTATPILTYRPGLKNRSKTIIPIRRPFITTTENSKIRAAKCICQLGVYDSANDDLKVMSLENTLRAGYVRTQQTNSSHDCEQLNSICRLDCMGMAYRKWEENNRTDMGTATEQNQILPLDEFGCRIGKIPFSRSRPANLSIYSKIEGCPVNNERTTEAANPKHALTILESLCCTNKLRYRAC